MIKITQTNKPVYENGEYIGMTKIAAAEIAEITVEVSYAIQIKNLIGKWISRATFDVNYSSVNMVKKLATHYGPEARVVKITTVMEVL